MAAKMPQQSQRRRGAESRRTGGRSKSPKSKASSGSKQARPDSSCPLSFTSAELCTVFVVLLLAGAFLMPLSEN